MSGEPQVDLMYLAWNRLAFTQETFQALLANTDWELVHELFVYDDGSSDGTREWLEANTGRVPAQVRLVRSGFGSPVSAMVHFIQSARATVLAKTDNDAMLPPGWLRQSLDVLDRHPELALLGIEAMYPHIDDRLLPRGYTSAQFISGLGLYRREAFARSRPRAFRKYFGLEEWQVAQGNRLGRGWITPAIPVFLLDRLPFSPWDALSANYARLGWQRSWPKYDPACTLWHWRWPQQDHRSEEAAVGSVETSTPDESATASGQAARTTSAGKRYPNLSPGDPRFLCAMRVKNEARYIGEALERALSLCSRALIFDDHSTDETVQICQSFDDRVDVFPSPFSGLDEARDKNYLLEKILSIGPEWVLWIDGDEVLERIGPEQLLEAVGRYPRAAAFSLRIAYLWDDPRCVRVDGIYGTFCRPSMFGLCGQARQRLRFQATGSGGNFHCGNIPQGLSGELHELDVRLKHYGYLERERRLAKYEWYRKMDPHNLVEDEYRHLAEIPGARFAPGPAQLVEWVE